MYVFVLCMCLCEFVCVYVRICACVSMCVWQRFHVQRQQYCERQYVCLGVLMWMREYVCDCVNECMWVSVYVCLTEIVCWRRLRTLLRIQEQLSTFQLSKFSVLKQMKIPPHVHFRLQRESFWKECGVSIHTQRVFWISRYVSEEPLFPPFGKSL